MLIKQFELSELRLSTQRHNSSKDKTKANAPYQSDCLLTFLTGSFGFKLSANFNTVLKSMHTIPYIVLSSFDLKNGHQSQTMKSVFKNVIFEN